MVARTNPRYYFRQWLLSGSSLQSEERRALRGIWQRVRYTLTGHRFQKWMADTFFWLGGLALITMLYTFASFECALGRDCTFASAHWANWLFGK
mgnify:FL=1